jgi:3-oxoadipate enol-lactonase
MIALELVLRHPKRVRALMLGCTHARWLSSVKPRGDVVGKFTLAALLSNGTHVERAQAFLVSPQSYAQDPERFARWLLQCERAGLPSVLAQLGAIMRHSAEDRLAQIAAPTLVITGTADRLVPPENSRRLVSAIPGARLLELNGAGHCFPFEREVETVAAARELFLGLS